MIYYDDGEVRIRDLQAGDGEIFTAEEIAQGWHQTIDKYLRRLEDQAAGKCVALAAEYHGSLAGYVSVYPNARWGPFGGRGWPEIVDFAVLEKYRRKGIGARIMDTAERIAAVCGLPEALRRLSREVEHDADNGEALLTAFREDAAFDLGCFLRELRDPE